MDCTLAALVACLSWSNLYIDSGLSWQDAGIYEHYEAYRSERIIRDGIEESGSTNEVWSAHTAANPYGRLAIGYEIEFSQFKVRLEASHISSIATNQDRGVNAISLGARWYPFRGGR